MSIVILENFEEFYIKTYPSTLKYIICKCQNFDDVNELVQETYIELYTILQRKHNIKINNEIAYVIGIAKNILKKYYRNNYKNKSNLIYFFREDEEEERQLPSKIDLEADFINQQNIEKIWNYLNNKNVLVAKIFYLYYVLGLKISEISRELNINESSVKNYIYRTLKDLKENFGKEIE